MFLSTITFSVCFFFFLLRCLLFFVLPRLHPTLLIYLLVSLMLSILPHHCPSYLVSSFVLYVFLVWLTSPLHCYLLALCTEWAGWGSAHLCLACLASCRLELFDSVELICPAEVQRGFWTSSCLALPGLTELTTLICLKFFVHCFLCS